MSRHDDESFVRFVETRSGDLRRIARHLTGNSEDAADLTQTVLERAYQRWGRIEANGDPFPYLRSMLVNLHVDGWRRGSVVSRVFQRPRGGYQPTDEGPDPIDPRPAFDDELARRQQVEELMRTLTARERAVVTLRLLEDLSEADTAAELGMAVGTVKSTCHKALAKLRVAVPATTGSLS